MELAHIKSVREYCNKKDYGVDSVIENDFIDGLVDDTATFIKSVRETSFEGNNRSVISDSETVNDSGDPLGFSAGDNDESVYIHKSEPQKGSSQDYIGNSKKIHKATDYFKVNDAEVYEDLEEDKYFYLDRIDDMKNTMEDAGLNVAAIPNVSEESDYATIQKVYKRVLAKYNNMNYSDISGQIIIGAGQVMEKIFDGRRSLFGMRPNLNQFTDRFIRGKLPSLKRETAHIVAGGVESMGLPEFGTLVFQIATGAIIYAANHNGTNEPTHGDYVDAMQKLNPDKEQ